MATYHLYYLNRGILVGSDDIEAADDVEAERVAAGRNHGRVVEVWNNHQRVGVIPPHVELAE